MRFANGWYIPTRTNEGPHPVERRRKRAAVIDRAIAHNAGRDTVVQAGAHLGLWPLRLAAHYRRVVAFEPIAENFECAQKNIAAAANIELHAAALGAAPGAAAFNYTTKSTGTHHVRALAGDGVPVTCIDALQLPRVDAVFLDVEGFEIPALRGAWQTIARDRPLLVVEENQCAARYGYADGDVAKLLAPLGYRMVERYASDRIYVA